MKIALCYHGIAKGHNFKDGGLPVGFDYEFDLVKKNLLDNNKNCQFDIFLHSWSIDYKEEILKKMNPKDFLFEKSKKFIKVSFFNYIKEHIKKKLGKGFEPQRINNIYSRWYSFRKVCELVEKCDENYDLVIVTRFDMCLLSKFDINDIESHKFYSGDWIGLYKDGKEILEQDYKNNKGIKSIKKGYPFDNEGVQDFFFIADYDYMINSFSRIFKDLKNLIKKYGKSNHLIALGKLKEDNKLQSHQRILDYRKDYFLSRWL